MPFAKGHLPAPLHGSGRPHLILEQDCLSRGRGSMSKVGRGPARKAVVLLWSVPLLSWAWPLSPTPRRRLLHRALGKPLSLSPGRAGCRHGRLASATGLASFLLALGQWPELSPGLSGLGPAPHSLSSHQEVSGLTSWLNKSLSWQGPLSTPLAWPK